MQDVFRLRLDRNFQDSPGPAVRGIFQDYRAVVRVGDLFHDRQAQAGSGQSAGVDRAIKTVEYMRQVVRADARPAVGDRQRPGIGELDLDQPTGRAEFRRVVEQVGDRPVQPGRDSAYQNGRLNSGEHSVRPMPPRSLDRMRDQLVQPYVDEFRNRLVAPGELDHIAYQAGQFVELGDDRPQHGGPVRGGQLADSVQDFDVGFQAG